MCPADQEPWLLDFAIAADPTSSKADIGRVAMDIVNDDIGAIEIIDVEAESKIGTGIQPSGPVVSPLAGATAYIGGYWGLPLKMTTVAGAGKEVESTGRSKQETNVCACFTPDGRRLFTGSSRGTLTEYDLDSFKAIRSIATPASQAIMAIEVNKSGQLLMTNSRDRMLRVFSLVHNFELL